MGGEDDRFEEAKVVVSVMDVGRKGSNDGHRPSSVKQSTASDVGGVPWNTARRRTTLWWRSVRVLNSLLVGVSGMKHIHLERRECSASERGISGEMVTTDWAGEGRREMVGSVVVVVVAWG